MKRAIMALIAAITLGCIASAPASAQTPPIGSWKTVTKGQDTDCHALVGSTYPANPLGFNFIYCGNLSDTTVNTAITALGYVNTYAPYAAQRMSLNTTIFYLQTMQDYCLVEGVAPGANFATQCAPLYNNVKAMGFPASAPDGYTQGTYQAAYSYVFQQIPTGTYPAYTPNNNVALPTLHEAGHLFDLVGFSTTPPISQSGIPTNAPAHSHWFLGDVGADAVALRPGADYYDRDVSQQPFYFSAPTDNKNFAELFAEIFEYGVSKVPTNGQGFGGVDYYYIDGAGLPTTQGWVCSEIFVWNIMVNGQQPTDSDYVGLVGPTRCTDNNMFPISGG